MEVAIRPPGDIPPRSPWSAEKGERGKKERNEGEEAAARTGGGTTTSRRILATFYSSLSFPPFLVVFPGRFTFRPYVSCPAPSLPPPPQYSLPPLPPPFYGRGD